MPKLTRFLGGGDASIARAKRPQELRAKWDRSTKEGLDWLRRPPSAKAPWLYRVLLALGNFVLYRVCAIKVEIDGPREPAGRTAATSWPRPCTAAGSTR